MKETTYEALTFVQKKLLDDAAKAMETAYNPYSHFYVGCAILTQNGNTITGSNVENAAYGSTICAERAAIVRANAMGQRLFSKVAMIDRGEKQDSTEITGPCGACRQMLYESAQLTKENVEIILSTTKKDKIVITTINELLPLAFGPRDLQIDTSKYET